MMSDGTINHLPVALVTKRFEDRAEFFTQLKTLVQPSDVRAFHQVMGAGVEITFFSLEGLTKFVGSAPFDWGVKAEIEQYKEVTITPAIGTGHVLIPDSVIWATMERFGEVVSGRRAVYKDLGEFVVETGARVFRVKPNQGANFPSSLNYGRASFTLSYRGMKAKCYRCQGPHSVKSCQEKVCFKCRGKGHYMKGCSEGYRCTVCWCTGHTYEMCPNSRRIRVELGHEWTEKDDPVPPYTPLGDQQGGRQEMERVDQGVNSSGENKENGLGKGESTRNGEGNVRGNKDEVAPGELFSDDLTVDEVNMSQLTFTPIIQQKRLQGENNRDALSTLSASGSDEEDDSQDEMEAHGFRATPATGGGELHSNSQVIVNTQEEVKEGQFPQAPFRSDAVKRAASPSGLWSDKVKSKSGQST